MKASNLSTLPDRKLAGNSAAFLAALCWADKVAVTSLAVYVRGETGTGKEALARRIHDRSPRLEAPFVAVNCAALPEALLETELFGVCRGAFTGAEMDRQGLVRSADGGSLFLDEIGDMSPPLQSRLLRTAQEGLVRPVGGGREQAVDIRWICASHRDLELEVREGRFRRDLYHRLCTLRVDLPPLRERPGDLAVLIEALGPRLKRETGFAPRLRPSALRKLELYSWPGNVRELHGVLAEALLRAEGRPIGAFHLALNPQRTQPRLPFDTRGEGGRKSSEGAPVTPTLEQEMIERVLAEERGNLTRAAKRIGWSRGKLYRRVRHFGLER